jgi:AraC-like DNA-binding protein
MCSHRDRFLATGKLMVLAAMNSGDQHENAAMVRADVDCTALPEIPGGIAGFQAAVRDGYFPYEVESAEGGSDFRGAGAAGHIGSLQLARIFANAAFSGFRAPHGRDDRKRSYVLMLKEYGGDVCFYGRRSCTLHVGEILLVDSERELETKQRASGASLSISIPARLLASRYPQVGDWCLRPLDASVGAAAVLRESMLSYWRSCACVDAAEVRELVAGLVHLIGAAYSRHEHLPEFESHSLKMHFLRVRELVSDHLENPDLSTEFVAARLRISKSYLYEVMSSAETTLGRFILAARLNRSRELLADPAMSTRSISDIAFSVGFQDQSHFSRRFRQRFHCSPRELRDRLGRDGR